jgi:glycosyltransferase involved in cell wall biosynthesis
MRILYDGYIFGLQKTGGINRYFGELISRLPVSAQPIIYGDFPEAGFNPKNKSTKCISRFPRSLNCLAGHATGLFDLIHPTYYELTKPLDYKKIKTRCVITIHDFIMARYERLFKKSSKVIVAQEEAIKRADQIICVSESTKSDLLERFPDCENRCSVIYLASSMECPVDLTVPSLYQASSPYFLYVGSRSFYKNFKWCLDALSNLQRRSIDINLVVAGPPWTSDEELIIRNSGLGHRIYLKVYPDDLDLARLYRNALALVYPSSYEGFGLPPLEAMKMGCPVIVQRISSLPEVVGKGGILMETKEASPLLIADVLEELLLNSLFRNEISRDAILQAQSFSWETTSEKTFDVYLGALA